MTNQRRPRPVTSRFLLIPLVMTPIAFVAAIPWLKNQQDSLVLSLTALAVIMVLASSILLTIIKDRQADEWDRSAARFATHWGFVAGGSFVALMLAFPPFNAFIVRIASQVHGGAPVDETLVLMIFAAGFVTCILAQLVFNVILLLIWRMWMSRAQ